jgi:hypothetical protein
LRDGPDPDFSRPLLHAFRCTFQVRGSFFRTHREYGVSRRVITSESVPAASNDYAWRRGVREYADNFHASVTRKGWTGTDGQFHAKIDELCLEAKARFESGDVPTERGTRVPVDHVAIAAAKLGLTKDQLVAIAGRATEKVVDSELLGPDKKRKTA